jgi:hypothetical protein
VAPASIWCSLAVRRQRRGLSRGPGAAAQQRSGGQRPADTCAGAQQQPVPGPSQGPAVITKACRREHTRKVMQIHQPAQGQYNRALSHPETLVGTACWVVCWGAPLGRSVPEASARARTGCRCPRGCRCGIALRPSRPGAPRLGAPRRLRLGERSRPSSAAHLALRPQWAARGMRRRRRRTTGASCPRPRQRSRG